MTSLKSIMERRTMQVLDVRDMKNLKGGKKGENTGTNNGGGIPPSIPPNGGNGDNEG